MERKLEFEDHMESDAKEPHITELLSSNYDFSMISNANSIKIVKTPTSMKYSCHECSKSVGLCNEKHICQEAAQCYQSHLVDSNGVEIFSRGCIMQESQVPFFCATSFKYNSKHYNVKCCRGNLCNNATFTEFRDDGGITSFWFYTGLSLGALACFVFVMIVSSLMLRRYIKKKKFKNGKNSSKRKFKNVFRDDDGLPTSEESALREIMSESVTSGSGSGLPLFVQRTLAKNIHVESIVGKGRYGEVWKGVWQGEDVAVKIFFSRDECSWARETEIYSTILLRHENILGFYGSDMTSVASCTQLWLVTHFHPKRSLFDYLQEHSLDHAQLLNICSSLINGLHHLHTEILGTQGKPAIAHRDVTSTNVLVKSDGACCIADLGLAVVRIPETGEINICSNGTRIGTKRYMSPEVLNGTLNQDKFDSFLKIDTFSSAIVMWEAAIRCVTLTTRDYETPYSDIFRYDPSFEEMRDAVYVHNVRPRIPPDWTSDRMLASLLNIINECWHSNPDVRLTSLRVKKNLTKIAMKENIEIVS